LVSAKRQTLKKATAVRIEIGCGSNPVDTSDAWPAYRKLQRGRPRGGAGNRVRERVFDSRAKLAGVRDDHRRRRKRQRILRSTKETASGRRFAEGLKVFFTRMLVAVHFTVARRRMWKASKTASSASGHGRLQSEANGGASRRFDRVSKTNAKSKTWMWRRRRKSAPWSKG
jgi:hypothetical protein